MATFLAKFSLLIHKRIPINTGMVQPIASA